jgi:hypothetical protein
VWWLDDLLGLRGGANDAKLGNGEVGGLGSRRSIFGDVVFLLEQVFEAVHGVGIAPLGTIEYTGSRQVVVMRGERGERRVNINVDVDVDARGSG